ncbi:hypothetical protein B0H11DRAFT_2199919 [Mycena galericulata]|nr:hypothetical protein B0H11DRAFT_2199919 [Mycena galericulata]
MIVVDSLPIRGSTWIAGNFVCDTLITISMVIILVQAQRNSRFKNTETVLNRLIINTIETGAITAGLALIQLVLFLSFPSAYYDIALEFVSGRMYSNVLIATLNGRQRSRAALQNGTNNFGTVCPDPDTEMNSFSGQPDSSSNLNARNPAHRQGLFRGEDFGDLNSCLSTRARHRWMVSCKECMQHPEESHFPGECGFSGFSDFTNHPDSQSVDQPD